MERRLGYLDFNPLQDKMRIKERSQSKNNGQLFCFAIDGLKRDYYFKESAEQNWTSRQLERNIKSGYYHRLLSTQENSSNEEKCLPAVIDTKEFIKDPYVLEFLDLPENIEGKESALESALINNLQKFLLELGKGFCFVARQFRISTETDHFYADLVFYNYLLKCFSVALN